MYYNYQEVETFLRQVRTEKDWTDEEIVEYYEELNYDLIKQREKRKKLWDSLDDGDEENDFLDQEVEQERQNAKEFIEEKKSIAVAWALNGRRMQREMEEENLQLFATPHVSYIVEHEEEECLWYPDNPYENWNHCYRDKTPLLRFHTFPFVYPLLENPLLDEDT